MICEAMKKMIWFRLLLVLSVPLWSGNLHGSSPTEAIEQHCYRETTGTSEVIFTWQRLAGEPVRIKVVQPGEVQESWCHCDGTTFKWHLRTDTQDITARRIDNMLVIEGQQNGHSFQHQKPIDAAPWYQSLSFALRAMLNFDQASATFWMIRPDTLTPVKLKAEKQQMEVLDIEGHSVEARRVRVRLTGWASILWHSHYWFRAGDHVFVHYRGVNGPSGTPETVVGLIRCESK